MKVILTQDVTSLGLTGQVVKVAPGYARNHLIPGRMALEATPSNLKRMEKERAAFQERAMKEKEKARVLADRIEELSLSIARKAGEKDKLFGSVTSMDLAAAAGEAGVDIDRRRIQMSEPIKALGDFEIPVRVHHEIIAKLKVSVVREG